MEGKRELSVIMPAYNEAENLTIVLPEVIGLCRRKNWGLVIVNDGSTDNTKEVLENLPGGDPVKVVTHKLNKGYGAAIKSGITVSETEYVVTIDADGQHTTEDIERLFTRLKATDADMVVGSRKGLRSASYSRGIGKSLIRTIAKILMTVPVYDLNSGMKIYRTDLAKQYLHLTPDSMSYSDIITLVFISNHNFVLEEPIRIRERIKGKGTIGIHTAFQTVMEIINIVILFNPMKIFLPISLLSFFLTLAWGIPLIIIRRVVSTGTLLFFISAVIFFFLGLIAEQLSLLRRNQKQ
jgi:glycosyltransferase involved in cell wall biosynthesis